MTIAGVVLCLVMLLAPEENLLRLYGVVLPGMALVLTNFVITQRFLGSSCCAEPPPPPQPTDWWSQLVSYLSAIARYFVDEDSASVVEVEDASRDCWCSVIYTVSVMFLLAVNSILVHLITVGSSTVERITLVTLVNLFVVPCFLELVGESQSAVGLANPLVCRAACVGMELWSTLSLQHMLYTSVRAVCPNNVGVGWMLVELWQRARRPLFVSWLLAYSAQFVDSLLAADLSADLSYVEVMLSTLRRGSWTPMMYLGLCSAVGYLTDAVWKSIYLLVARAAARQNVTDNGQSEVVTLLQARLLCVLLGISTADMFTFAVPYLAVLMAVRWIYRGVQPLLLAADRRTAVAACVAYSATIVALPSLVVLGVAADKRIHLTGNLFIALCFCVRGASTLVQCLVRRRCATADDADSIVFVVRVSTRNEDVPKITINNAVNLFCKLQSAFW